MDNIPLKLDLTVYKCSECSLIDLSKSILDQHILDHGIGARVTKHVFHNLDFQEITEDNYVNIFLNSSMVILDPQWLCQEDDLKRTLDAFAKRNDIDPANWRTVKRVLTDNDIIELTADSSSYFKGIHLIRKEKTPRHPVECFIESSDVILDPTKYCPFDDFKCALKVFEDQNGYRGSKYTADFFRSPFAQFNISKTRDQMEYRGRSLKRDYLLGIDLVHHDEFNVLG